LVVFQISKPNPDLIESSLTFQTWIQKKLKSRKNLSSAVFCSFLDRSSRTFRQAAEREPDSNKGDGETTVHRHSFNDEN